MKVFISSVTHLLSDERASLELLHEHFRNVGADEVKPIGTRSKSF